MISDKYFKLFFVTNKQKKARLGIVIAKRYMPKSVDRNQAKREIRELFRIHRIKSFGIDLIVMARNASRLDKSARKENLGQLFSQVVIRCAEF